MPVVPLFLTLQNKKQLTHDVFELEYISSEPLNITPGQFLLCDTSGEPKLRRSYSVSWAEGTSVFFIIKRLSDGKGGSAAICDQGIGHEMQVWGPMGHFVLRENTFPQVFIGTGTGFAPLYFMLKYSLKKMNNEKGIMNNGGMFFLFGVRELRDVFYQEELQKWSEESSFDYQICCSREVSPLPDKHREGRVTDFLKNNEFAISPPVKGGAEGGGLAYMRQDFSHIPYHPELVNYAREQRQTESLAEKRMWYDILKEKKLSQYKFTRQKPLLNYIADFYCSELGLVIEVDGDDHEGKKEYDEKRTRELESYGLKVLRFHNLKAMEEVPAVEKEILEWIEKRRIDLQNPPAFSHPSTGTSTSVTRSEFVTPPPGQGGSTNYLLKPETEFYICGSPAMVTEVRSMLDLYGISKEKVFFEQY